MWWGHYRPTADRPQRRVEALASDPHQTEREVLRELSIEFARDRYGGDEPLLRPVKRSVRLVGRALLRRWGAERWPLPTLMRWQYQRYRRSIRTTRGLDSSAGARR